MPRGTTSVGAIATTRYRALSGRLQPAVDLGVVGNELSRVVGVALRPSMVALWLSGPVGSQVER